MDFVAPHYVDVDAHGTSLGGFRRRALLIYDGIHYDVLVRRGPSGVQSRVDPGCVFAALALATPFLDEHLVGLQD